MYALLAFIFLLSAVPVHAATGVNPLFGKVDLAFERNEGQADSAVKFLTRGSGYSVSLTDSDAVIRFISPKRSEIRMKFLGQRRHARVEGFDALPGTTNYFLGNGTAQRTNVQSYKRVRYSGVYSGIDVEYHGNGRSLEYDLILAPGANPDKIRIAFSGTRGTSVNSSGDLVLNTEANPIVLKKPHVYQEIDGSQKSVDAAYAINGRHVGFKIGEYDKSKPLIIDPELIYSTFFGGTQADTAFGIAVDLQGSIYIAGSTASTDFPIQSAAFGDYKGGSTDAFVFKLDPTGSKLIYSTFIGGSATDEGHAVAVDSGGNAYVTGFTQSSDFPVVNAAQRTRGGGQDAYIVKLNSSGTAIVYSTFLGGMADDRGTGIALDAANNAYVTGVTASTNFPIMNPYRRDFAGGFADGFVTKFNTAGNIIYSTYVGGIGNDNPLGIAVDGTGAAYVTGWTTSVNFPLVNAFQTKFGGLDQPIGTDDVFVFKLNPSGTSLDYSTYIGGTGSDEATRIAVDASGSAYITGYTTSINFPTANPFQAAASNPIDTANNLDAFITKLAPDGKSLVFSTYFGGFQNESGTGIAVDSIGDVYISGYTMSSDLPAANSIQSFIGGGRDAFVAKFDPAGNVLVFSTFLGASGTDGATGLTIDAAGNAYIVGFTSSGDFNATNAVQAAIAGGQDAFVAKLNVQDIVSSSAFQVAPEGVSSVVSKGTRTDAVFGYAVGEPAVAGAELTGLEIIDRKQNGATVSEVGIAAPQLTDSGRLFVDVTSTGRSVLSIANPSDQDATVDFFYTDGTGATTQFAQTTVTAHQHFSRFVTDTPLNITSPGTLNFSSSIPVAATAFFTNTNESNELLLSNTPIVNPVVHTTQVRDQPVTLPEFTDGAGWKSDIILVNTSEDRMNGEVRFFSAGSGNQPGTPTEVGIGDASSLASAVEFDIPSRSFQKISTAGSFTITEVPFALSRGTSLQTPGGGTFQVSGWAAADSTSPDARLNGLAILENRQLGITQSETGVLAPSLRQTGRFFAEVTDKIRSFIAIANPNNEDVAVDFTLTDDAGTPTGPFTVFVPAQGQYSQSVADQPIGFPSGSKRNVSFRSSLPVLISALRYFTNERNDTLVSAVPIIDIDNAVTRTITIPHFADGAGWKTRVILVNNSESEQRGEIRFLGQGSSSAPPPAIVVGTDTMDASTFEYDIQPRGFFELQTNGLMADLSTGSVQIVPFDGFNTPPAYVIASHFLVDDAATAAAGETRVNTIFEMSVEGQVPATSLRFYAEAVSDFSAAKQRSTATSIAIANPSSQPATVQLELTSFSDARLGLSAPIQIAANGQFAAFLSQIPGLDSVRAPFQGVLSLKVLSGSGVTASTFRILYNERLDILITATGPLNENAGMPGRLIFPYFTDSTGYTTQFILINPPGVQSGAGTLHFFGPDGSPLQIDSLKVGSVQVVPFSGFATPHAHILLQHRDSGVLTTMIGIEGQRPASSFRIYAESIGDFDSGVAGSTRSGLALANPSGAPATVVLEMRNLDGSLLRTSQPFQVPPTGEVALFLNQVPGFETLPAPLEGVLRVVARSPQGITATGLRAMNNERGNRLFTTTGPLIENAGAAGQLVFPHIAEGGGYTTQFVVIGGTSGQPNAGVLRFFTEEGNPLNLTLAPR